MSRVMYESQKNLGEEQNALRYISQKWGVSYAKLPISYKLDYTMYRNGTHVGFIEVKCRTNKLNDYKTYILSLSKVKEARILADMTNTKSLLIVRWSDYTGWINLRSEFIIKQGGRSDRNDWQDQEPVCHFNISKFKIIAETKNFM